MYSDLANLIISVSNIEQAYFELSQKLFLENKTNTYKGIDDLYLSDLSHNLDKVIADIREELIDLRPIRPVLKHSVPKKSGNPRIVYSCSIKDRIKSQAISQVIDPIFDEFYSPYLFSYRTTHPTYYAARSVVRRYKRHYGKDWVLIRDAKDFAEYVDHEILLNKFRSINLPGDVIGILMLFAKVPIFERNNSQKKSLGLLQGIPLVSPFENLYLTDLDFILGKKLSLYRRVGDDLIGFDHNREKVEEAAEIADDYFKSHKLISSRKKARLISSQESFNFLGYTFRDERVSICSDSLKKIKNSWQFKLQRHPSRKGYSLKHLKNVLFYNEHSINKDFYSLYREYPLVDDFTQAEEITVYLWKLITKYIRGKYTPRDRRIVASILKSNDIDVTSYLKFFIDRKNGFARKK